MTEAPPVSHERRQEPAAPPRSVLVTGAGGFVGSRVVELLAARGDTKVTALDVARTPRGEEVGQLPGVDLQIMDLRDVEALDGVVSRSQAIIHLAAVRTQASSRRPRDAHDINVGTTYDLLTLAATHGVDRFVFGSTNTMYGPYGDPDARPSDEAQPWVCRGINMYAATKLAGEAYLEAFSTAGGPDYVALRIGPIYGPGVSPGSNSAMALDILEALDRGEPPVVRWAREAVHSFVYIDDVAAATIAALTSEQTGLAINVVGEPVTTAELCELTAELYGHDPTLIEWREERTRYQRVSQDRMRNVLGFVPQTSTEDGLRALIAWHRRRTQR